MLLLSRVHGFVSLSSSSHGPAVLSSSSSQLPLAPLVPRLWPQRPAVRGRSTRLFVFERLSEQSIATITTAQEQSRKLYLSEVGNEVLMAGCICHPDQALRRTLTQYSITWRRVQPTLVDMYAESNNNNNNKEQGWLSNFRAAKDQDNDLPFSRDFKQTLRQASRLADQMGCTTIEPHHLFLALLEYQEGSSSSSSSDNANNNNNSTNNGRAAAKVSTAATINDDDVCTCGGWAVLVKMNVLAETDSALDVCRTLLAHILDDSTNNNNKELVTGTSNGSKTPTLAECGTDLTEQATNGQLDPVHGRNTEIRSCLRTLIRRRKNNVRTEEE